MAVRQVHGVAISGDAQAVGAAHAFHAGTGRSLGGAVAVVATAGAEAAAPAANLEDLDDGVAAIDAKMLSLAQARFGIAAFRPGQAFAIRNVLVGIDTLAIMPTGAGKSLCYQLPALELDGVTLVVSPLIALMKDQHDKLEQLGIDVLRLDSTLSPRDEAAALAHLSSGARCVAYVTPERLSDPKFRTRLQTVRVALFVVDEAHCISQWGHDFRPAYLGLGEAVRALGRPPVLALTATAPAKVKDDILAQLGIGDASVIDIGLERPNLRYHVFASRSERRKKSQLLQLISAQAGCGIVYAATVKTVEAIADFLIDNGIPCGRYHGRMRAKDREAIQSAFMDRSEPRIMVATNAFGLGVDKQEIRFVVHYNFPGSLESYYQEAGRAGRDGKTAQCVLLYHPEDKRIQSFFLGGRYPTPEQTLAVAEALIALSKERREPSGLKEIAERAATPSKKARVILSFLKEIGVAKESAGAKFTPLAHTPPTVDDLARATQRYEQKRSQDRARLQWMLRYAQSHICRTRILVSYFGYPDDGGTCGTCDNCVAAAKEASERPESIAETLAAARSAANAAQRRTRHAAEGEATAAEAADDAADGDTAEHRRAKLEQAMARRRLRSGRSRALKIERQRSTPLGPSGLDPGDLVRHPKWGDGEIIRIEGDTVGAFFPSFGEKLLKASFLEKLSSLS